MKRWARMRRVQLNDPHPPKRKKILLWVLAHSSLWPLGFQSVLEAKIEIPDTPVVNIAHARPAL